MEPEVGQSRWPGAEGAAWGDYDNDGDVDLYLAGRRSSNQIDFIYRNEGEGRFSRSFIGELQSDGGDAVAATWADFDNDGHLDLLVVGGRDRDSGEPRNVLYAGNGVGGFNSVAAGTLASYNGSSSRLAVADMNQDGFLDVYLANAEDFDHLYVNQGNENHWFTLKLVGGARENEVQLQRGLSGASNRDAVGARIQVTAEINGDSVTLHRQLFQGDLRGNMQPLDAHFGLGDAETIGELRIDWPSGTVQILRDVPVNQRMVVEEISVLEPGTRSITAGRELLVRLDEALQVDEVRWFREGELIADGATSLELTDTTKEVEGTYRVEGYDEFGLAFASSFFIDVDDQFEFGTLEFDVSVSNGNLGMAWADMDEDGDLDVVVTDSETGALRAFRNEEESGLVPDPIVTARIQAQGITGTTGLAWGGFNADTLPDLFVVDPQGGATLSYGDGPDTMAVPALDPWDQISNGRGVSTTDFNRDGHLDLLVLRDANDAARGHWLFANQGAGAFQWVEEGLPVPPDAVSSGAAWGDFDGDGWPDVFVANRSNDHGEAVNGLYRNVVGERFELVMDEVLIADRGVSQSASWGDYDNDEDLDLFVANDGSAGGADFLYRNDGEGGFVRVEETLLAAFSGRSVAGLWGDYDADGFLDLLIVRQGAEGQGEPNLLLHNERGESFTRVVSGSLPSLVNQGTTGAWVDVDNSGHLDLVVGSKSSDLEPGQFFRNLGSTNHWFKVRLRGATLPSDEELTDAFTDYPRSNPLAIGAKLTIGSLGSRLGEPSRTIGGGDGINYNRPLEAHFGLSDRELVRSLKIEWPSGLVQYGRNVPADQVLEVEEPLLALVTDPPGFKTIDGAAVTLRVMSNVNDVTSYRWFHNGRRVFRQNDDHFVIDPLTFRDLGSYHVEVLSAATNDDGTIEFRAVSLPIELEIPGLQELKVSPASVTISEGDRWRFEAEIEGTPPFTYTWRLGDEVVHREVSDSKRAELEIDPITEASAGEYVLQIETAKGRIESEPFVLEIDPIFSLERDIPLLSDSSVVRGLPIFGDLNLDGFLDVLLPGDGREISAAVAYGTETGQLSIPANPALSDVFATHGSIADFDNDGSVEIVFGNHQVMDDAEAVPMYSVNSDGDVNLQSIRFLDGAAANAGLSWIDADTDGFLDLFFGSVVSANTDAALWLNQGDGGLQAVTPSIFNGESIHSASVAWCDFDRDGDLDVFLANGEHQNQLYRNDGRAGFTDVAEAMGVDDMEGSRSAVWGDLNFDGFPELFVANGFEDGGRENFLFINDGGKEFSREAIGAVVNDLDSSWACAMGDLENDGDLDIVVGNGRLGHPEANAIYLNNGAGKLSRTTLGSPAKVKAVTRGVSLADFNEDGSVDLVFSNIDTANHVFTGKPSASAWLKVRALGGQPAGELDDSLAGLQSNRSGIGAKVSVWAFVKGRWIEQHRQIMLGDSLTRTLPPEAHFGFGESPDLHRVRVEWPSGNITEMYEQEFSETITVRESAGLVRVSDSEPVPDRGIVLEMPAEGEAYQWYVNGGPISSATNRVYRLPELQLGDVVAGAIVHGGLGERVQLRVGRGEPLFEVVSDHPALEGQRGDQLGSWQDVDRNGTLDLLLLGSDSRSDNLLFTEFERSELLGELVTQQALVGAAWADIDNDGFLDLWLLGEEKTSLFGNNGFGRFGQRAEGALGIPGEAYRKATWVDVNQDGYLDFCGLTGRPGELPVVRIQVPSGGFTQGPELGLTLVEYEIVRSIDWSDVDSDGDLDLLLGTSIVEPEAGEEEDVVAPPASTRFLVNDGQGTLELDFSFQLTRHSFPMVDAAFADFDNDGDQDVLMAKESGGGFLYVQGEDGVFVQGNDFPIATIDRRTINGASWLDVDNDGDLDLFVTHRSNPPLYSNSLFRNFGEGDFVPTEAEPLVEDLMPSSSATWGDFDRDGDLDLFVASEAGFPNRFYRNRGNENHWLTVQLAGSARPVGQSPPVERYSNQAAIGAKVTVVAEIGGKTVRQLREIFPGDGTGHFDPLEAHFGLGDAGLVSLLRVDWPSGRVQEFSDVTVDQLLTIIEPGPALALRVLRPILLDSGELSVSVEGEVGAEYFVESSNDLISWERGPVIQLNAQRGRFTLPVEAPVAFFRLLPVEQPEPTEEVLEGDSPPSGSEE